jgi:hypothetical protein
MEPLANDNVAAISWSPRGASYLNAILLSRRMHADGKSKVIRCQISGSTRTTAYRVLSGVLNSLTEFRGHQLGGMHQWPTTTLELVWICWQKQRVTFAREIGEMGPDVPLRPEHVKELYALTELSKSTEAERNKFIYEKMEALAREVGALKPRDARRADIKRSFD